jgi:hypothetical protein
MDQQRHDAWMRRQIDSGPGTRKMKELTGRKRVATDVTVAAQNALRSRGEVADAQDALSGPRPHLRLRLARMRRL